MQNKIMCVGNNRLVHPPLRRAVIDLFPSRRAVELRVVPDHEATPGPYRVLLRSLKERSKVQVVRLDARLMPRADGDISVFAVSALLAAGAYELALTTEGARPDTAQNTLLIQVRFVPALRDSPEGRRRPSRVYRSCR
jgi:hypothetical protein